MTIWTVGHSTRSIDEFVALLRGHRILRVADVRRYPGSRRHPQFTAAALAASLRRAGIEYLPFPVLGGRRRPRPDSRHTVWKNAAFRGYADYMDTQEFQAGLDRLIDQAREAPTAILCSEAVWWRCHRSMIADALKVRGIRVEHIVDEARTEEHPYTSAASIVDGRLHYGSGPPADPDTQMDAFS